MHTNDNSTDRVNADVLGRIRLPEGIQTSSSRRAASTYDDLLKDYLGVAAPTANDACLDDVLDSLDPVREAFARADTEDHLDASSVERPTLEMRLDELPNAAPVCCDDMRRSELDGLVSFDFISGTPIVFELWTFYRLESGPVKALFCPHCGASLKRLSLKRTRHYMAA